MINLRVKDDPVGQALHFSRMSGTFYCRSEFTAPCAMELPAFRDSLMFHVITADQCFLKVDANDACLLKPGDLALVPHGAGHVLASEQGVPATKLFDMPRRAISNSYETINHGEGDTATSMICALVHFVHPAAQQLIRLLPKLIHIDTWKSSEMEWIQNTLCFIAAKAQQLNAGGETVITRLADILVIQTIRAWIARDPAAQTGLLGALRDKQIGRAIAMIHREPGRSWTVVDLACAVAMSRSAFSARFTQLVGEPVMQYAMHWKMQTALTQLRESRVPVAVPASQLGYDSEAAFSRAFKRVLGISPGAARLNATSNDDQLVG